MHGRGGAGSGGGRHQCVAVPARRRHRRPQASSRKGAPLPAAACCGFACGCWQGQRAGCSQGESGGEQPPGQPEAGDGSGRPHAPSATARAAGGLGRSHRAHQPTPAKQAVSRATPGLHSTPSLQPTREQNGGGLPLPTWLSPHPSPTHADRAGPPACVRSPPLPPSLEGAVAAALFVGPLRPAVTAAKQVRGRRGAAWARRQGTGAGWPSRRAAGLLGGSRRLPARCCQLPAAAGACACWFPCLGWLAGGLWLAA